MISRHLVVAVALAIATIAVPGCSTTRTTPRSADGDGGPALAPDATGAVDGRWREVGEGTRRLEISARGDRLEWEYNGPGSALGYVVRGAGKGRIVGDEVELVGRIVTGPMSSVDQPMTLALRREGDRLRGIMLGPRNVPVPLEFERAR